MKELLDMDWWWDYFDRRRIGWVFTVAKKYTHGDPVRFEEYFGRARDEMGNGIGHDLVVEQDDADVMVTYEMARGKFTVHARMWVVRRIRKYADEARREASDLPDLTTDPVTQSLCAAVADSF